MKKSLNEIKNREYIILHLEETKITQKIFEEIVSFVSNYRHKMKRLGIVGTHGLLYWKFKDKMTKITALEYYFCNDLQKAKNIIVGLIRK